jgi:manganese/iron transport system substrate-binding protein
LNCQGLTQAIVAELEPGEYRVKLTGFTKESTLLFAGAAAGHHHHDGDPHYWLDPISAIQYVNNIRDGLIKADPDGKEIYATNAENYVAKLKELDADLRKQADTIPAEKRLIVTNHESFGYFADRYGFKIIGTIVPSVSTGATPSAQQLARLVDHIKSSGASSIFLETGTNPQLADQIARETGVKVVTELYTHSITPPDGKAPTYIDMMKYNMNTIVENLK